jgi:hypothetical protein
MGLLPLGRLVAEAAAGFSLRSFIKIISPAKACGYMLNAR